MFCSMTFFSNHIGNINTHLHTNLSMTTSSTEILKVLTKHDLLTCNVAEWQLSLLVLQKLNIRACSNQACSKLSHIYIYI